MVSYGSPYCFKWSVHLFQSKSVLARGCVGGGVEVGRGAGGVGGCLGFTRVNGRTDSVLGQSIQRDFGGPGTSFPLWLTPQRPLLTSVWMIRALCPLESTW